MALPTVGRIVYWYVGMYKEAGDPPRAGIVAAVEGRGRITLAAIDTAGGSFPLTNIPFIEEGQEHPAVGHWAEWMPYQLAEAKKKEVAAHTQD